MEEHHHGEEEPALIIRHVQPSQNNLKSMTIRKTWWDGVQCRRNSFASASLMSRDVCLFFKTEMPIINYPAAVEE